jgi:glycosyltransferase involved in cell wall biosynthesis
MATVFISANSAWYLYNFRLNTIRALQEAGARILVAAPADAYAGKLQSLGCEFSPLRVAQGRISPLADLLLFLSYLKLYRRYRPAICLHFTIKANVFGTLAAHLAGTQAINNVSGLGPLYNRRGLAAWLGDSLNRLAIRLSKHTYFQNRADRDALLIREPDLAAKTSLIPGSGVDLNRFRPAKRAPNSEATTIFLFAARMLRDKGALAYLQLAESLLNHAQACRFLVAGEAPAGHPDAVTDTELRPFRALPNVSFLGHRDDMESVLQQVDCVILPTRYNEGIPKILIEAAACGLPIICSNQPGCREIVENGVNGILCGTGSAEELREATLRFLSMSEIQRTEMGLCNRKKAQDNFAEELTIRPYVNWLKDVTHIAEPQRS